MASPSQRVRDAARAEACAALTTTVPNYGAREIYRAHSVGLVEQALQGAPSASYEASIGHSSAKPAEPAAPVPSRQEIRRRMNEDHVAGTTGNRELSDRLAATRPFQPALLSAAEIAARNAKGSVVLAGPDEAPARPSRVAAVPSRPAYQLDKPRPSSAMGSVRGQQHTRSNFALGEMQPAPPARAHASPRLTRDSTAREQAAVLSAAAAETSREAVAAVASRVRHNNTAQWSF